MFELHVWAYFSISDAFYLLSNKPVIFLSETEINMLMRIRLLFSLFIKMPFFGFRSYKKNIVSNYAEDVDVLQSNHWRHLLRWRNAFSTRDVRPTPTDCDVLLRRFLVL